MPEQNVHTKTEHPDESASDASAGNGAPAPASRPSHHLEAHYPELDSRAVDIDVNTSIRRISEGWKRILVVTAVAMLLGLIYVLGSSSEFESSAGLLPEEQPSLTSGAGGLGIMQQFGGLLGLSPNALSSNSARLPVQVYPEILNSIPFQISMLETELTTSSGRRATVEEYLTDLKPFDLWEVPAEAAAWLAEGFRGRSGSTVVASDSGLIQIPPRRMELITDLRNRISAEIDKKTSILYVSAEMPDPTMSAGLAQAAVVGLQQFVTRYRRAKLEADLAFIEGRHREARDQFIAAQRELAQFQDRNSHLARNVAQAEGQRLQADYDIAFNVYNTLATRLEEAKIKLQEETPAFQVIEPVSIPLQRSHPRVGLILLLCFIVGIAGGAILEVLKPDARRLLSSLSRGS